MGFSGGSSSGSQSSQGYGYNQSLAQSLSGQSIWGPQGAALQDLYGRATGTMNSQANIGTTAQNNVNSVMPGARAGMAGAQDLAAGKGALGAYAAPNNDLARRQSEDLASTVGNSFRREILPSITSNSVGTGNMGGSRDALARGVAGGDAARAISQGSTDLYAQQYGIGAQAAQGFDASRLAAASALPEMASSIYNLGMMPSQAQWAPLVSAAGIFGGPTTLSSSISQAQTQAENFNASQGVQKSSQFGFNFF